MRGGGRLFIVAGIAVAVVAIFLAIVAFRGGDDPETPPIPPPAEVTVVEALRDVPAHRVITSQDVGEVRVPEAEVAPGSVSSAIEVVGQAYRMPLETGQRLLSAEVEQPGLASEIRPGYRAISVPADTMSLLSGLVQDDDYIDVIYRGRINVVRLLGSAIGPLAEDAVAYALELEDNFGWVPIDFVDEFPPYPPVGDPGSQLFIRDGIGAEQQLEAVAKVMLQDIRILRVVRPGQTFDPNGQPVDGVLEDQPVPSDLLTGYLVMEVTNQQAELLTFLQDERHAYQVIVRARGDHQTVNTTGITFEILAANEAYALPIPGSVTIVTGVPLPGDVQMPEELEEVESDE